tara:strand:+ start:2544 stop:4325 length:1782 start_codon:yes stop_codon:yes gene_type:complete
MAETAKKIDTMDVPEGGIADFVMSDKDADEIYGPEDDGSEEFGDEGIAQFPALTKKMAAMGREGDDTMAHVQTGELIIPAAFIEENPEMKETIFAFLEQQGVKDPERYIVGAKANSINPDTGAAEFFFKKYYRKVIKKVKKVVKTVVKVVKKLAPIILPIALAMTPLGAIYGAALGSGIGTLIQGGSIKDALKSALIAGVTGGAMKGVGNVMSGTGKTFMSGFTDSLANPAARFGQTISGAKTTFGNVFGGEAAKAANAGKQTLFSDFKPTAGKTSSEVLTDPTGANTTVGDGAGANTTVTGTTGADTTGAYETPKFGESIKDAFTPGGKGFGESMQNAFMPNANAPTATDFLTSANKTMNTATAADLALATKKAGMASAGLMRTYGPAAALGTAGAAASGFFTTPEQEDPNLFGRNEDGSVTTGTDLVNADPSQYMIKDIGNQVLDSETGQYISRAEAERRAAETSQSGLASLSTYQAPELTTSPVVPAQQFAGLDPNSYFLQGSTPSGAFARPFVGQTLADGGQVFPRRNGGIMPDEGIPNQDSVRAMLMPGEFVMTTDAVKGLGNGNMDQGIKNMYSVMRNLENRERATT